MKKYYLIILIAIISIFYIGCEKDEEIEESNEIPIANFSANPRSGPAPLTVTFTDHSENIPTSWLWTLGDNSTSTIKNPIRTYNNEGSYSVTLSVMNKVGSDTKINTNYIIVTASNTNPEALFTVSPSSGTVNTSFAFNALGSTDDYDLISDLLVRWDFDGNGSWDTDWDTVKTQNYQYSNKGSYNTQLEVKDNEGLIDQYTKNITVNANAHPNALFTVTPTNGRIITVFEFSASSSTDDDLISNLQVRWDLDGNGTWDTGWDTSKIQTHQYSNVGNYEAKLEVKDVEGLTDQYIKNINVIANVPPTALFTISPYYGSTNTNYIFNASSSTDDFDPIGNLEVRWDFDGNGTWDTDWDTDKIQTKLFSNANTYTAKLEVKDTEGLIGEYSKSIIVHDYVTGTFTDPRDGQTYNTIEIGNQTWFAENLNYDYYSSVWYDNSSANGYIYGRLYTWLAARQACPIGWDLPSDNEWKTLERTLGMSQSEADDTGWRGTNEGACMKETGTDHWVSPNTDATNGSGFSALPGGLCTDDGEFTGIRETCTWWTSSTELWGDPYRRWIEYDDSRVHRDGRTQESARSVRCIKD